MSISLRVTVLASVLLAAACAAAPGTRPHDMSTLQHEAAAKQEDRAASGHLAKYDPNGTNGATDCTPTLGPCWENPTEQHNREAEDHRELAVKHRAAAAALAQAEAQSCAGISEANRDTSPFFHKEDIASVRRLTRQFRRGKSVTYEDVGATVVFRAVPGLTAEWLQREVDCHIARASSVGHDMPEMSYCPLVLKGVRATVSTARGGFAVNVASDDWDVTKEIVRRSNALLLTGAAGGSGTSSQ